jgi:ubiquitin-protein ligase
MSSCWLAVCRAGPTGSLHNPDGAHWDNGGDQLVRWIGVLTGPEDTPYADGTFYVDIRIPNTYPFTPPKVGTCQGTCDATVASSMRTGQPLPAAQ